MDIVLGRRTPVPYIQRNEPIIEGVLSNVISEVKNETEVLSHL